MTILKRTLGKSGIQACARRGLRAHWRCDAGHLAYARVHNETILQDCERANARLSPETSLAAALLYASSRIAESQQAILLESPSQGRLRAPGRAWSKWRLHLA
jgi:hypothetical protein